MSTTDMQPATLKHSNGSNVPGFADREAFDAGAMYVDVQFDLTSLPTGVHRSKVIGFDSSASQYWAKVIKL